MFSGITFPKSVDLGIVNLGIVFLFQKSLLQERTRKEIPGISFLFLKSLFPKIVILGTFLPKTVILFPKAKIFMFFISGILSLYPLKPFIYADSDILPFFPKTLLRKITMSVITPHYPVFCNFRYPPLLPLDTPFMPRKARKKEL